MQSIPGFNPDEMDDESAWIVTYAGYLPRTRAEWRQALRDAEREYNRRQRDAARTPEDIAAGSRRYEELFPNA